jgi:hypothetical protein
VTIIAGVKVRDGLILATDSMTQVQVMTPGGPQVLKAYSNARKVFQIGDRPIGAMTYGLGNIGHRSIEGLVLEACSTLPDTHRSVEEVTDHLFGSFQQHYVAEFANHQDPPLLGLVVAGYSRGHHFPEEREFVLPTDQAPRETRAETVFGAIWRGIDLPFIRLYKGFDTRLVARLRARGMDDAEVEQLLGDLEVQVLYDGMPVQDAVDFAVFILTTTIGMSAFETGAQSCGGPLQVATILPDRGFEWVARPALTVRTSLAGGAGA